MMLHSSDLLAQLFLRPLPVWDYWYLLLLPLCAGIAIVYKSVRCDNMADVPKQAIMIFIWILVGMAAAAFALAMLVKLTS